MALHIGWYGEVLRTLHWDILRTSCYNVPRTSVEDILRLPVGDVPWRYIKNHLRTPIGRLLATSSGRDFAEWVNIKTFSCI